MKIAFTFICSLFIYAYAFSQPVLDHVFTDLRNNYDSNQYDLHTVTQFRLSSGLKFFKLYGLSDTVEVYNADYSFHSFIILPLPARLYMKSPEALFFTDKLFDLDDGIEYIYRTSYPTRFRIYNQDGSILFQENYSVANHGTNYNGDNQNFVFFSEADSTFKMALYYDSELGTRVRIFTLPGTLPGWNCCCDGKDKGSSGIIPLGNPGIQVYPNPSEGVNFVEIPKEVNSGKIILYDMQGEEVKTVDIPANTQQLEINNSILPSGTYVYKLISPDLKQELSKKILIIK